MRIIDKKTSREACAEAGWYAWDIFLEQPTDEPFIMSLRPLGGFTYLPFLSKPFFKIESSYRLIKGLKGERFLRIAIHGGHPEEMEEAEELIRRYQEPPVRTEEK